MVILPFSGTTICECVRKSTGLHKRRDDGCITGSLNSATAGTKRKLSGFTHKSGMIMASARFDVLLPPEHALAQQHPLCIGTSPWPCSKSIVGRHWIRTWVCFSHGGLPQTHIPSFSSVMGSQTAVCLAAIAVHTSAQGSSPCTGSPPAADECAQRLYVPAASRMASAKAALLTECCQVKQEHPKARTVGGLR